MSATNQCRFCNHKGVIDLTNDKTGSLMSKLHTVLTYKLETEEGLTQFMCRQCFRQISDLYAFQMQCLRHEITIRKKQSLPSPEIKVVDYSADPAHSNALEIQNRLSDSGLDVLRRNMKSLNDKIASLNQENALMKDKVEALDKENGDLKKSILQYNKTLPDITNNMTSLLSRMEQQFEVMNTRVMNDLSSNAAASRSNPALKIKVIQGTVRKNNLLNVNSVECDEMDIDGQIDEDDLLRSYTTTIYDETQVKSYYTVLVPRRPINANS